MLNQPTLEQLNELRLHALARAWQAQHEDPAIDDLGFDERMALLAYPTGTKIFFDLDGFATQLVTPQGTGLTFAYTAATVPLQGSSPFAIDPAVPMTVTDTRQLELIEEVEADTTPTGRSVQITYKPTTGRVDQIIAHDLRAVTYIHDEGSDAKNGNLIQVQGLEGVIQDYVYDDPGDPHNVGSFRDEPGVALHVNVYDAEDRVLTQTHGLTVWTFTYDDPQQPGEQRTVQRAIFDDQGNPSGTATTSYEFNSEGYLLEKVDPVGNKTVYVRDTGLPPFRLPFLTSIEMYDDQSVLQRTINLKHDAAGNLLERQVEVDPVTTEVVTEAWTYNQNWIASRTLSSTASTDRFHTEFTFYTNASGAPTNVHEIKRELTQGPPAVFETTTLTYNSNGQLETVTPPGVTPAEGLIIRREYFPTAVPTPVSSRGLLKEIRLEDPDGLGGFTPDPHLKRSLTYDASGFLDILTDAETNPTDFDFDSLGRVARIENALGEATVFTYTGPNETDPLNPPIGRFVTQVEVGKTASEGQVRRLIYNDLGHLVRIDRKNDAATFVPFTTRFHDSDGDVLRSDDGVGRTLTYAYDLMKRLGSVSDEASPSNVTSFGYDFAGNRTSVQTSLAGTPGILEQATRFEFDDLDRLVEVEQQGSTAEPLSLVTAFQYDAAANVIQVTDPKLQQTDYAYDALSRLESVTQPLSETVSYCYDSRGRLDRVINARSQALDYGYEDWGGLQTVGHDPGPVASCAAVLTGVNRTVGYGYDNNGNVLTVDDTLLNQPPNDRFYTFTYDALNRVETVDPSYLPGGPRLLTSSYDRFGNRDQLTWAGDAMMDEISGWPFNKLDQLTGACMPQDQPCVAGMETVRFGYFDNDDLQTLTHGALAVPVVTTSYTYKPHGPIESITATGATQLHKLTYTPDPLLNVASIVEEVPGVTPDPSYSYGYDGASRLTQALLPASLGLPAQQDYAYDGAGNRDEANGAGVPLGTSLYNANSQLITSPVDALLCYDADGNLATKRSSGDCSTGTVTETFTFDTVNRLSQWTDGSEVVDFLYDPFGRRLKKTSTTNGATWYLWDGDQLVAEYDALGVRQTRYAYAGGFAPVQVAYGAPGLETVYHVHADHLDTPKMLTDSAGVARWRAAHEAFGRVPPAALQEDPDGDTNLVTFNIRFPGQYFDAETGLHYNRFRYYDPNVGRYTSADPIGQFGILLGEGATNLGIGAFYPGVQSNLYAYVLSNPLSRFDLLGLYTRVIAWSGAGWGSSSFGHVTADINGTSFSFGPGGNTIETTAENEARQDFRSGAGVELDLTPEQEAALAAFLQNPGNFNFLLNNCGDPVESGLESLGFELGLNTTPTSLLNSIINTPGLGISSISIPQMTPPEGTTAPWAPRF